MKPRVVEVGYVSKDRVYVDDPSEAPEDVEVHQGERGGLWYETDETEREGDREGGGEGDRETQEDRIMSDLEVENKKQLYARLRMFSDGKVSLPKGVDFWDKVERGNVRLEEGDIVKVDDTKPEFRDPNRSPNHKIFEVVDTEGDVATVEGVAGRHEGITRKVNVDGTGRENKYGNEYYPTGVINKEAFNQLETESEKISRILHGLDSEDRVKASVLVTQEAKESDDKLPHFQSVYDSLSQEELKSTFVKSVTSSIDAGITRDLDISWFEGGVPGEWEDSAPSILKTSSQRLGYLTSRMDGGTMISAIEEAKEKVENETRKESIVNSGGHYGQSAEARKKVIEDNPEFFEDDPVAQMQTPDSVEDFLDVFLSRWVSAEYTSVSQHIVSASTNFGPNNVDNVSDYTTGVSLFAEESQGAPIDRIEMTDEMRDVMNKLYKESKKYHEGEGVPKLFRGVRNEVTTHGSVESWTKSKKVAKSFNGHSVLEAEVDPEAILVSSDMLGEDWPQPENVKKNEEEYILLGGAFEE